MSSGPTPSQQTNRLLQLAEAVISGESPERLRDVLQERLDGIGTARNDFEKKAREQGEAFLEQAADELEAVQEGFDGYEQALHEMANYFDDSDNGHLRRGCESLKRITPRLFEALDCYGRTYLRYGPSRFPLVNLVRRVVGSITRGEVKKDKAREVLDEARQVYTTAVEEINASKHRDAPGMADKRASYQEAVEVLDELEDSISTMALARMERAMGQLDSALAKLEKADEEVFESQFMRGPTRMPAANLIINTADAVLKGLYPRKVLEQGLEWYDTYTTGLERQFEAALQGKTSSVLIQEELPVTREILDLHDEAMDALEEALDGDFTEEVVRPLLERIEETVERLYETSKVYEKAAEMEGKTVCLECGRPNPVDNRFCEACGVALSRVFDPERVATSTFELRERDATADEEVVVTQNVLRIFQACYDFHEGKTEADAFRATLNWARQLLSIAEAQLRGMQELELTPEQSQSLTAEEQEAFEENRRIFEESRELFFTGIDEFREGLDHMEYYIQDGERETIMEGIQLVWEGAQKVHQVKRVGDIAQRTLAELESEEEPTPA